MSIYNPQRRFMLSIVVVVVLAGLFVAFRNVTSPYLDVEHKQGQVRSHQRVENASKELQEQAIRWFPDHTWVGEARKYFHDGGRYLYCKDFNLINDDKSVSVRPIAMIWHTNPDEDPVTIVADAAQLDSSTEISPNSTELGRITSGFIAGNVQINGPRGLQIQGRTFHLAEDSMKLWSSDVVRFRVDEHHGFATGGVEIYLQAPKDSSGGLTSVTDVRQVRLNGKVVCNLFVPAARVDEEDLKLRIEAAGGFSFDVLTMTGTFSGLTPRPGEQRLKNPRDEVWVKRLNVDQSFDWLVCPELMLKFRNAISVETGLPVDGSLALEHVTAWGRHVLVRSEEHNVTIDANELRYAVDERRIDVYRTSNGTAAQATDVKLVQGENVIMVPHVRVLHTAAGGLQRVELNGAGKLTGKTTPTTTDSDKKSGTVVPAVAFGATWLKSLVMQVAPDQMSRLVSLHGGATVSETSREFDLSAQTISMKLKTPAASAPRTAVTTVSFRADASQNIAASNLNLAALRPEIITASQNVVLHSPQGNGLLRKTLAVRFEDIVPAPTIRPASTKKRAESPVSATKKQPASQDHVSFESDTLDAVVGLSVDPENREVQFRNVWLNGDVEIVRQSEKVDRSFTASGNQLFAAGTSQDDLEIKLFGDPARLSSQQRKLEGPRIDLAQVSSEAKVVGSGRIRFVTDKGFDGRKLATPTPLDIYWSDHMVFQRRSADFVGNIRIVMHDETTQDIEILCAGLTVKFSKDIALGPQTGEREFEAVDAGAKSEGENSEVGLIQWIECHNRVTVRIDQFTDGELHGRHRAEFVELKANLESGDFTAIGPGHLESVSPDKDGQLQGSAPVTVRANTPSQTTETAFVYMKTEFIGDLSGNLHRREANLTHNVVALVAPARRVDEKINLEDVLTADQLPERAGILQAEQVTVSAIGAASDPASSFAIVARENARLESRSLSASADVITYDHQKQQFIIRAEGDATVTVNHRDSFGGKFNHVTGKRFEYYRRTNQLSAAGFGGLKLTE